MFKKITINTEANPQIRTADTIEEIICLASLIASKQLEPDATIEDMGKYFDEALHGDCPHCKLSATCLLTGMYGIPDYGDYDQNSGSINHNK